MLITCCVCKKEVEVDLPEGWGGMLFCPEHAEELAGDGTCPCPLVDETKKLVISTEKMARQTVVMRKVSWLLLAVSAIYWFFLIIQITLKLAQQSSQPYLYGIGAGMVLTLYTIFMVELLFFRSRRATVGIVVMAEEPDANGNAVEEGRFEVRGWKFKYNPPQSRKPRRRRRGPGQFEKNPYFVPKPEGA